MSRHKFVTAKEIADKLEISYRHFHRRRRELGLEQCRDRVCPRRFVTEKVERQLRDNGHEVVF
jgi:hypothetical protein